MENECCEYCGADVNSQHHETCWMNDSDCICSIVGSQLCQNNYFHNCSCSISSSDCLSKEHECICEGEEKNDDCKYTFHSGDEEK